MLNISPDCLVVIGLTIIVWSWMYYLVMIPNFVFILLIYFIAVFYQQYSKLCVDKSFMWRHYVAYTRALVWIKRYEKPIVVGWRISLPFVHRKRGFASYISMEKTTITRQNKHPKYLIRIQNIYFLRPSAVDPPKKERE